jgi:hypothetical protein
VAVKRALAAAVIAAAAVVGLLVLALGWWQGSSHQRPARLFSANATLSTRAVSFGDPLGARLDLLLDPAAIDVDSVRVRANFDPWRVAGSAIRKTQGDGVLLSYRYKLDCLEQGCLPQGAASPKRFQPAVVSFRTRAGGPGITQISWPTYRVSSWLGGTEADAPAQHLRYDASLPAVSYRTSPGTLQAVLAALAALLVLAAGGLLWLALRGEGRRGPVLSPLERALAAVRASTANGHAGERRKALGWLGRELGAVEEDDLARGATRLAWSKPEPTPETTGAFADDVEERG